MNTVVYLVTKNPGKIKAAKSVFDKFAIKVEGVDKDFPEIQADSSLEIARHTALQATRELNLPVIREDHSLFISALGYPGPYTNFIERKTSPQKLLKILKAFNDRTGYFEIATVYAEPNEKTKEYVYRVQIHFKTQEVVKDQGYGWNGLICLQKDIRAFTEYPEEERLKVWNRNYYKIAKFLSLTTSSLYKDAPQHAPSTNRHCSVIKRYTRS